MTSATGLAEKSRSTVSTAKIIGAGVVPAQSKESD
jgi:hypothetical protein